jgi:hypothetical protein
LAINQELKYIIQRQLLFVLVAAIIKKVQKCKFLASRDLNLSFGAAVQWSVRFANFESPPALQWLFITISISQYNPLTRLQKFNHEFLPINGGSGNFSSASEVLLAFLSAEDISLDY